MQRPVFVARHVKTGITALNVLAAALGTDPRTAGIEVRFARGRDELADAIRDVAAAGGLPVVGWSFYSPELPGAAAELAWIRKRTGGVGALHVAGGPQATAEPLATLRTGFDLVALGEGETTAIALLAALAGGKDPRGLRGLAHLDEGRLASSGHGERRPLDDFPAFDLPHRKFNPIEITRGCVYACRFCQTPFMFKARVRHRSVDNVREHARILRREGLPYVRFITPTALSYGSEDELVDLPAVEALLAAVREAMGPEGRIYFGTFPSEVRPEHVTPEALAVLKRYVDNDNLVIGGQSGSQRVLDESRRGHGVEDIERAVRLAIAGGFRPNVDFLLGLPGEAPEDRRASLRLAERLVALGARIHGHAFMPLPGTPWARAAPEPIEADVAHEMARMESRGALYGQWRHQLVAAADLARRRISGT
jgi:B12-binding domain/radical SAM domain protein